MFVTATHIFTSCFKIIVYATVFVPNVNAPVFVPSFSILAAPQSQQPQEGEFPAGYLWNGLNCRVAVSRIQFRFVDTVTNLS